jgi:signal transduction histidine kinase
MTYRLLDPRRAVEKLRQHGAIAALASAILGAFTVLAVLTVAEYRAGAAGDARRELAVAGAAARQGLDQDRRVLDQLAASTAADMVANSNPPFVNLVPSLAPGIRAAVLLDPTGAVTARSPDAEDDAVLAGLAGQAVTQIMADRPAPVVVMPVPRQPEAEVIGLARPWFAADGAIGGIALIALDRTAFAGLDIMRPDGTRLFGGASGADMRQEGIPGFPLLAAYRPVPASQTPFVLRLAIIAAGLAAMVALFLLWIRQQRAAAQAAARHAEVERGLRDELAKLSAARERTDETARAQSRFFAQVTHELRTPLNAILGFAETIRQEMFGPVDNPRYQEYARLIHDAGSHLLSLINDLLDSARIEAGKMEIAPMRVSAAALARSALDLVELAAERRGVALTATGLPTCPDLNVDPRAFKQVLVNLLSNGIKFTPTGGHIAIDFAQTGDRGVAIAIADSGIGMSPEDIRLAFEPFGRGGGDRARRQEGTGLGLSLARALVRLHGGELTLTSCVDAGTTATVTLPASAAFAPAEPRLGRVAAEPETAAPKAA